MSTHRPLRSGDRVVLRSAEEILATLDDDGTLDGLPFMPEMLAFAGRELVVSKRAEKLCDTINWTGSRHMSRAVHLDGLRCDGSSHDGCQAGCLLIWKEEWLRPVAGAMPTADDTAQPGARDLKSLVDARTRAVHAELDSDAIVYRCQATQMWKATRAPSNWESKLQYVREVRYGNVALTRFARVTVRVLGRKLRRLLHRQPGVVATGDGSRSNPYPTLDLAPGELVRVRPMTAIAATLDTAGKNRGLSFDWEMAPYCGGVYRVKQRVRRLIDDRTGRMIEPKNDCIILDGVTCSGDHSDGRWFCTRAIYPYWREAWLERTSASRGDIDGAEQRVQRRPVEGVSPPDKEPPPAV
jgi:hypothetical protein